MTSLSEPPALPAWVLRLPGINRLGLMRRPRELVRFLKFATVGAIGMVVDLSILNVMHKVLGLPLLIANSISFSTAVVSNFTWNRLWTFPESRQRPIVSQLGQFALVNIIGLGINNAVLWTIHHLITGFVPDPFDYNLAKITAIGVVLFWNFFVNRMWTYRGIK
jgi:putative flippase GtrA